MAAAKRKNLAAAIIAGAEAEANKVMSANAEAPPAAVAGDNRRNMTLAEMIEAAIADLALVLARSATPLSVKVPEGPITEEQAQALITCSKQATLIANDIEAKRKSVTDALTTAIGKIKGTAAPALAELAEAKVIANKALEAYMVKAGIDQLRNEHGHLASRRAAKLELEITDPTIIPLEYLAPDESAITAKIEAETDAAMEAAGDDKDEVNRSVVHARENAVPGARLVFSKTRTLVVS